MDPNSNSRSPPAAPTPALRLGLSCVGVSDDPSPDNPPPLSASESPNNTPSPPPIGPYFAVVVDLEVAGHSLRLPERSRAPSTSPNQMANPTLFTEELGMLFGGGEPTPGTPLVVAGPGLRPSWLGPASSRAREARNAPAATVKVSSHNGMAS